MTRMKIDRLGIRESAKLLGLLSVFAIGLLCSKPADASFLIDAGVSAVHPLADGVNGVIFDNVGDVATSANIHLITGSSEPLELLYRATTLGGIVTPTPSLQSIFSLSAFTFGTSGALHGFNLVNSGFSTGDPAPRYLIIKDGTAGNPLQYVFDLQEFKSLGGAGTTWAGQTIQAANFWVDTAGITDISLWGNPNTTFHAVPEPASVALVGFGVFCLACGPLRRRMRKAAGAVQAA